MIAARAQLAGWLAKGSWTILGQAALTAASFVLSFTMARSASLHDFGIFATLFSIQAFLRALVGAAIYGPMPFLAPGWQGDSVNAYLRGLAVLEGLGSAVLAGLLAILLALGGRFFLTPEVIGAGLAMLLSLPFVTWIEFSGKLAIQQRRLQAAFAINGAFLLAQILVLVVLARAGSLTVTAAFLGMALAAAAALPLSFVLKLVPAGGGDIDLRLIVSRSRRFTAWGTLNILITQGYIQVLYVAVAALAGAGAVGLLEGPRLVVAPLMILLTAWGAISSPPAAERFARSGMPALLRFYLVSATPLLGGVLLYLVVVNVFADPLFTLVFGHGFAGSAGNLLLWSLTISATIIATVAGALFYPAHRPEFGTMGRLSAAAVTLLLLYPAIYLFGTSGAIGIRMIGEVVTMLVNIAFALVLLWRDPLAKKSGNWGAVRLTSSP